MTRKNSSPSENLGNTRNTADLSVFKTLPERENGTRAFDRFLKKMEAERACRLDAEIARLKSSADVCAWQAAVRMRMAQILGDFPDRTPLRAHAVGKLDLPGVSVEKIIFESQPNYYVTANLYIPKKRPLPAPGILLTCGHLPSGKTGIYGDAAHCMALKGYVAMVFDPTGQGERSECIDLRSGRHLVDLTVCQHHWTGKPCLLTDMTLAGYRTWDGIRCIDYLLTRKEIDPKRIGVMGNSGGGIMTLLITAVDERIAACAASHPGGSMENMLLRGYIPPDRSVLSLIAPRPCRIIVGDKSNEERGHRIKLNIMKPFYAAYGCPERLELVLVDGYHDLLMPKRVASYKWFNRWFSRQDEGLECPKFRKIAAQRLWCTKKGQVQRSIGGETMASLNSARAKKITPRRPAPGTRQALQKQRKAFLHALKARICFQRSASPLNVKKVALQSTEKFNVEHLLYDSEPGMPIPALLFTPETPLAGAPVIIHACEEGKPTTLDMVTLPVLLACRGFRVLSIDVRDTGEGALCAIPRFPVKHKRTLCAYDPHLFRREILAVRALGLGRSRSGMRALDIIRAGDLLKDRGLLDKGYVVVGEGSLGVCALKAAAFDTRAAAVIAVHTLTSYRMLTDNPYYNQFQYFWTPGVLKDYDIPDLPALVAPRPVAFISAVDHLTRPVDEAELRRRFSYALKSYAAAGRPNGLILKQAQGLPSICRNVVEVLDLATCAR